MKEVLLISQIRNDISPRNNYDPTCFDKNIHIRLRNYKEDDVISGLEDKLSFVLSYFIQKFIKSFPSYSIDFNIKDDSEATKNYIFSKYINEFKQSDIYREIVSQLQTVIDFKDIVIKPLYSKKFTTTKVSQFGNLTEVIGDNFLGNTLSEFISLVRCESIKGFLSVNSLSLMITEYSEEDPNEKYISKNTRKIEKELKKSNGYHESKLW